MSRVSYMIIKYWNGAKQAESGEEGEEQKEQEKEEAKGERKPQQNYTSPLPKRRLQASGDQAQQP